MTVTEISPIISKVQGAGEVHIDCGEYKTLSIFSIPLNLTWYIMPIKGGWQDKINYFQEA